MTAIRKKELKELQPQKKFALHQKYMKLKRNWRNIFSKGELCILS